MSQECTTNSSLAEVKQVLEEDATGSEDELQMKMSALMSAGELMDEKVEEGDEILEDTLDQSDVVEPPTGDVFEKFDDSSTKALKDEVLDSLHSVEVDSAEEVDVAKVVDDAPSSETEKAPLDKSEEQIKSLYFDDHKGKGTISYNPKHGTLDFSKYYGFWPTNLEELFGISE